MHIRPEDKACTSLKYRNSPIQTNRVNGCQSWRDDCRGSRRTVSHGWEKMKRDESIGGPLD